VLFLYKKDEISLVTKHRISYNRQFFYNYVCTKEIKINNNISSTFTFQPKQNIMARVSTYLNFSRKTEEAFTFYKSVFGGEFAGGRIARFSDIPTQEGMPQLSEEDKNLVMHIELPILGGHMLMGTDAPESIGFNIIAGNNVNINLEPDTREETKRLYEALSAGGKITMELQDVFWGAYYGSCTDKYGIQWLFNCANKEN
jgi:PhnB protein